MSNAVHMLYLQDQIKRKSNHFEAEIRRIKDNIERNKHVQNEKLREANDLRLKRELEDTESRLKRLIRTGNPF